LQVTKLSVAVLASGRGSDLQSIIDGIESGKVNARVILMLTDNPEALAIGRAKKHGVPVTVIDPREFTDREQFDAAIWKKLDAAKPDLVVLAGYMRIVRNGAFIDAYRGRMINIHPSLLPKYPGAHAQKDAFVAGEKVSGYTIHFVDSSLDGGPVIHQEKVDISGCRSADEAAAKILVREHVGLPMVVQMFAEGSFAIDGKRVTYHKK